MYKRLIEGKKAVIFDLDGTLVQTEYLWRQAFDTVLTREGGSINVYDNIIKQPGLNNVVKWKEILDLNGIKTGKNKEQLSTETQMEYMKLLDTEEIEVTEGFWDLAVYLKSEKSMKLALTTNTHKNIAEKVLDKLGIHETFDYKIYGDEVKNPKPNPEMYETTFKKLEVKPQETLVFEDSPVGAKAAKKAGADVVIVWDGEVNKEYYPEDALLFVPDFTGLANNMDHTFEEAFNDYRDLLLKKEQKKN